MIAGAARLETGDVPRETMTRLDRYAALLIDWQSRVNLVGPSTIPTLWQRHFDDSLQLLPLAPHASRWLDIGSGAGFPGMVLAVADPLARVTLVESIAKKCRFLHLVADELGLTDRVRIENVRIEALQPMSNGVITARALASLKQLFTWGLAQSTPSTLWILPKGTRVSEEIDEAKRLFRFEHELVQSRTDPRGRIVIARRVVRR